MRREKITTVATLKMDSTMQRAARKILKMWQSFRDRRVFAYLRHAVCRAEVSLTHQVLRKIAPIEAFILRDPTLHARLRFRFGGSSFPPVILYKIFVNANVQYVAGTTKILAGSKAANDACDLMGERKYFDIVLADIENCTPLADSRLEQATDIPVQARLKEHGLGDQHPIWLGGRGNGWRLLIDDKYHFNENVLRFDASLDLASGKSGKLMDAMLQTIEQSVLAQHVHSTVPFKKQYASRETLDRIKTSQLRARSRGMHNLYAQHLRKSQEEDDIKETHTGNGDSMYGTGNGEAMSVKTPLEALERLHLASSNDAAMRPMPLAYDFVGLQKSARSPQSRGEGNTSLRSSSTSPKRLWSSSASPPGRRHESSLSRSGQLSNGGTRGGTTHGAHGYGGDAVDTSLMDDDTLDHVADSLLNWAGGLSFEQYHEKWENTAATIIPEPP